MSRNDYTLEINGGHVIEYFDDTHTYLVDGVMVPSISGIARSTNPNKYAGVSEAVLNKAASAGTAVHKAIEDYCEFGEIADIPELRGFRFLQRWYNFEVVKNEVPVALFRDGEPYAAGRLDLLLKMKDSLGLADIKRTSGLDRNYLAYQLNLYRVAYEQSYGEKIAWLAGIHLYDDSRKFVDIPVDDAIAEDAIKMYEEGKHE